MENSLCLGKFTTSVIILSLHLSIRVCVCVCVCVCERERERERESGRSPEAIQPRLETFFFFAKLQLDATSGTPPTLPAKALAPG